MLNPNLSNCGKCGAALISEEVEGHVCLANVRYVGYILINGVWFIDAVSTDGLSWKSIEPVRQLPPPTVERPFKSPSDGTEPKFANQLLLGDFGLKRDK